VKLCYRLKVSIHNQKSWPEAYGIGWHTIFVFTLALCLENRISFCRAIKELFSFTAAFGTGTGTAKERLALRATRNFGTTRSILSVNACQQEAGRGDTVVQNCSSRAVLQ
jgi:hypothetical protein